MANILTQSLERMSPSFSILRNALITPGKSWPTRLQPLKAGRKGLAELRIHRRKETVPIRLSCGRSSVLSEQELKVISKLHYMEHIVY